MKKSLFILAAVLLYSCSGNNIVIGNGNDVDNNNSGQNQGLIVFKAEVTTQAATDVTTSSAVLHASYEGVDEEFAPQEAVFRYGTDASSLTNVVAAQQDVNGPSGTFSASIKELTNGQTYYFQASMDAWNPVRKKYVTVTGKVLSFTTEKAIDTKGLPGWAELPEIDYTHHTDEGNYYIDNNNKELYYTHHWGDEKTAASGSAFQRNYTVCWNSKYKCPLWVAAPRHEWYENGSLKNRNYIHNPDMPKDVQYSNTSGSGTYNRGHMLGAAERNKYSSYFSQVNYITNIAPQHASYFNTGSGGWNTLEDWVDGQVCSDTLYVVIGCYFDSFTDGYGNHANPLTTTFMGTDNVQVPTMMYYLLLRTKKGNSGKSVKECSSSELKCAAFVRAHAEGTYKQSVTNKEMMSVEELEKITGITYFTNVPNAPKSTYSASDWGL